jgi:serine/threonine protein kinase
VCYVMEFMEAGTLHSLLCEVGQLPEKAARFYAAEIILAVNFLHECGIVHR